MAHQQVYDVFRAFSLKFEGLVYWPYLDIKGLVTVGIGNLIDPIGAAIDLPWHIEGSGEEATRDEIAADWKRVKTEQRLSKLHFNYARPLTRIRLSDEGVDKVVKNRLLANETYLKKAFPNWDKWPADSQLCAFSMAWAVGAGFPGIFKNFTQFANKGDWANAAKCAAIKTEGNPGIIPRNAANQVCLHNAHAVATRGLDPRKLYYPGHPDPIDERIWDLQAEAKKTLAEWKGVPYRFPEDMDPKS